MSLQNKHPQALQPPDGGINNIFNVAPGVTVHEQLKKYIPTQNNL